MRFAWIQAHRGAFGLTTLCRVLGVSRGGYYAWVGRAPGRGPRAARRAELLTQIRRVHAESRDTYGSPRVHRRLAQEGVAVCENTVARLMREEGVASCVKRRFRVKTTDSAHAHPVADNLLGRDFQADLPDRRWCCDLTYVPTGEGFLYVACVLDLCSRKVVGWAMADHLRAELCLDALAMAVLRRKPHPGVLHHSDRGVQYACGEYRRRLEEYGMVCSMSRKGNCYDNAAMESFMGTLKTELVYHESYATRQEAKASIFEYIEVFYNRKRLHSSLGYLSPEAFEASLN